MIFDSHFGESIEKVSKNNSRLRSQQHEIGAEWDWSSPHSHEAEETLDESFQKPWRYGLFSLFIITSIFVLLGRLFDLQIIHGRENLEKSEGNRVLWQELPAPRGVIYDARGEILARNYPGPSPGEIIREYPQGGYFSHVLGYTGEISPAELAKPEFAAYLPGGIIGREGLESYDENELKGEPGRNLIEVDSEGEILRTLEQTAPVPGKSLYLSLDAALQQKAGEVLSAALKKYQATGAVFVAQRVKDGKVLALLSLPTFDNNLFARNDANLSELLKDGQSQLFDRALAGEYPPGSTVKPAVGAAALQEKIITPQAKISDEPQVIRIGAFEFPDWTYVWGAAPHGNLNIVEAIAESCDIFFYKIGGGYPPECRDQGTDCQVNGLGVDRLKIYFKLFGLGEPTGIDLPGEAGGLVPDPIWKENQKGESWYLGNTYHVSIGQGDLLTTPLQINNLVNTIANGGKLFKPQLVEKIVPVAQDQGLEKEIKASLVRENFIDPSFIRVIREGMRVAVEHGIIYPLRDAKVAVAAKTGTAEFGVKNARGQYETHAWVTGFAPFDDPKISFTLLLEAGGASSNAAETAREILDWYFSQ